MNYVDHSTRGDQPNTNSQHSFLMRWLPKSTRYDEDKGNLRAWPLYDGQVSLLTALELPQLQFEKCNTTKYFSNPNTKWPNTTHQHQQQSQSWPNLCCIILYPNCSRTYLGEFRVQLQWLQVTVHKIILAIGLSHDEHYNEMTTHTCQAWSSWLHVGSLTTQQGTLAMKVGTLAPRPMMSAISILLSRSRVIELWLLTHQHQESSWRCQTKVPYP